MAETSGARSIAPHPRPPGCSATSHPLPLQVAERVLQPVIGKSLILYAVKDRSAAGGAAA